MTDFDKYRISGAYHWRQSDSRWGNPEFNPVLLSRYQVLARMMPSKTTKNQSVLDIGCGDGYLLYAIACKNPGIQLYGIDSESLGISLAEEQLKKHNYSASLVQGSAYSLPFSSSSFDVITNADVIEHLEDPEKSLQEMQRVLRNRGLLLLSTPNRHPNMKWDERHIYEFDPIELRKMLEKYFSKVEITACWPIWWVWQWKEGGQKRKLINSLCRLGINPFLFSTHQPTIEYGQLIAKCIK
ncbi:MULTISPECIES: methyltransferase domain-containing protein [Spirulina sp. CCY15215]|uniref:class I SAM-dependent methyltransferase n=1 Tax=Spirulina sp. CCY15215 TaxID=2767591 RepID=UPI0019507899